ncbi:MAG: hypothetical protein AAGG57_14340 [Pseudomonadota bacterium]
MAGARLFICAFAISALNALTAHATTLTCQFREACFTGEYRCMDYEGRVAISDQAGQTFGPLAVLGAFLVIGPHEMIGGNVLPERFRTSVSPALNMSDGTLGLHTFGQRFAPADGAYGFAITPQGSRKVQYLVARDDGSARLWSNAGRFGSFIYKGQCEVIG